jgi:hypothetical protein
VHITVRPAALIAGSILAAAVIAPTAAEAAVNYFDTTKVVYGTLGSANCPTGWKAVGGGYEGVRDKYATSPTGSDTVYEVDYSKPNVSSGIATGWRAAGTKTTISYSTGNVTTTTYYPKTFVVCAS